MMIENAIKKLTEGQDLTFDETNQVIDEIMTGNTSPIQISSFLTALSVKKETVEEIAGAADAMRAHALEFHPNEPVLEIATDKVDSEIPSPVAGVLGQILFHYCSLNSAQLSKPFLD